MARRVNQVDREELVTAIKEENKISEINLQKVLLEEFYGELNYPDDLDRLNLLTFFYEELKNKKSDVLSSNDIEYFHICIGMYETLSKMIKCVDKLLKKAKEENSPNKYFYKNYKNNVLKKDLKRVREWMLCASQDYFKTIKF